MSLINDQFFYAALKSSSSIMATVEGRIFNPSRTTADENEDRIPYIIITLDSVTNDTATKDDVEGDTDTVEVSILCVTSDREALAVLAEAVRRQVREYLHHVEEDGSESEQAIAPYDWAFSASGVEYDDMKPCVYQTLHYSCSTNRD